MLFTVSYQHSAEVRESRKNGSNVLRSERDKVRSLGLSVEALMSAREKWTGNIGFEAYNDLVNSNRTDTDLSIGQSTEKRGLYPDGATMSSLAVFTVHNS